MFFKQAPADYVTAQALGLATVLQALHKADMYLIDIKPSNMLMCKHPENGNQQLYLADVEDVIFKRDKDPRWVCTKGYSCEIQNILIELVAADFPTNTLIPTLRYAFVDWVAFSRSMQEFAKSKQQGINMNRRLLDVMQNTESLFAILNGPIVPPPNLQRTYIEKVLQDWRNISTEFLLKWKEERIQCPTPRNNQALKL
jgi:hypothetical protein